MIFNSEYFCHYNKHNINIIKCLLQYQIQQQYGIQLDMEIYIITIINNMYYSLRYIKIQQIYIITIINNMYYNKLIFCYVYRILFNEYFTVYLMVFEVVCNMIYMIPFKNMGIYLMVFGDVWCI